MTLTLLLDLDGTLLENHVGTFVPAYLHALSGRMSIHVEPGEVVKNLLSATELMIANQDPCKTLAEVFDAAFYPALNIRKQDVQATLDSFYADDFPRLRDLTRPIPQAIELVGQALERGFRLAIATNPIFPRTAIDQRLSWANLPAMLASFAVVPSYETFHFAKPNPTFFAELLAQMGWPDEPVIMLGDDFDLDIASARQMGLQTFWLTDEQADVEKVGPHGRLSDVLPWCESFLAKSVASSYVGSRTTGSGLCTPAILKAILRAIPAALFTFCRDLPDASWARRSAAGEWSPVEILWHWRDVDIEVNYPRLQSVLAEKNPFLEGKNTDLWAQERKYQQRDARQALFEFAEGRRQMIALLEKLNAADWQRPARHAIFGPTHLQELVGFIADHDRMHIKQFHQASRASSQ